MGVRSDYSLDLQLEEVLKRVSNEHVKRLIETALHHMRSGRGGHRRGGETLIGLLDEARERAASAREWAIVRLLQDSLDYAEERILQPDFNERYRLFQDGERNEGLRNLVGNVLEIKLGNAASAGREFLAENPDAGAEGLLAHLTSLSQDARYLAAPPDRPGRYSLVRGRSETVIWLERVLEERIDIEDPHEAARRIAVSPEAIALLAADTEGQMMLRAAELQRRSVALADLRHVTEDPRATESELQRQLESQYWIFGGRFVGTTVKRRLVPGDEFDIPLLRGDGSLQIVELKRAMGMTGPLVKRHRGAWVPTAGVHDAVGQAVNYLVGLDENRQSIHDELGIEARRASAIVLIGHPALQPEVPEQELNEALRIFNTHVNRVEVLTYKELIDNAERSLGSAPAAE